MVKYEKEKENTSILFSTRLGVLTSNSLSPMSRKQPT
jgi:hypothetical protein